MYSGILEVLWNLEKYNSLRRGSVLSGLRVMGQVRNTATTSWPWEKLPSTEQLGNARSHGRRSIWIRLDKTRSACITNESAMKMILA
jgi:hypothetical protein